MIHVKEDFFNKVATDIRAWFFPNENHGYTENKNYHATTYTIELFNNGCLTYRTFIGRLAKYCNSNNATIHNFVEKHIASFGEYQYRPRHKWSESKVEVAPIPHTEGKLFQSAPNAENKKVAIWSEQEHGKILIATLDNTMYQAAANAERIVTTWNEYDNLKAENEYLKKQLASLENFVSSLGVEHL
jgi:hypothetical protein